MCKVNKVKIFLHLILAVGLVLAFSFTGAAALAPIPGIPENPANTENTNTAPIRQPSLTCDPYAVFDPEGVLFDDEFGMPVRHGYRIVEEYYREMRYLAKTYPEIVKLHEYGTTKYYKWPLLALEISNNPGGNDGRAGTMHQAGNHPREWQSNEMCMDLAWLLITQYGKKADVTELLNSTTVWLLPLSNPDGVHYDMTVAGPGSWRGNLGGADGNTINSGSDLNRNWPYGWGSASGSSPGYGNGQNRGGGPESEPEIAAVTALARSNSIITSISGHQFPSGNGQYLVFPWSFFVNRTYSGTGTRNLANSTPNPIMIETPNGQVDIRDMGYRQAKFNLHSSEYSNIMYAYSGESGDYLYGTLRTLPFLYEYGRYLMQSYMGQELNFATTSFNDLYTGKQREFQVTYATATNAAGAGAPTANVTAELVFITDDGFVPEYGPITATTSADVIALGSALNGKILVCVRGVGNNDNAAIALAAQRQGAVGVLFCTRTTGLNGYQHSHFNPNLGTGTTSDDNPALINIPVAGTAKQYLRELYESAPGTTMTFHNVKRRLESNRWTFERNLGGFMENMLMAPEYASYLVGSVSDSNGNLIRANLNLKMQVFSPLIEGNTSANAWADQITQSGVFEQTQTGTYSNVSRGAINWAVTPSKQPANPIGINATQFPDLGYDITISAPGMVNKNMNIKVPMYQMNVDLGNIVLTNAVTDPTFKSIEEIASGVWILSINVKVADPVTGNIESIVETIALIGDNANFKGKYKFEADSALAGYTLNYDITDNGSKIGNLSLTYGVNDATLMNATSVDKKAVADALGAEAGLLTRNNGSVSLKYVNDNGSQAPYLNGYEFYLPGLTADIALTAEQKAANQIAAKMLFEVDLDKSLIEKFGGNVDELKKDLSFAMAIAGKTVVIIGPGPDALISFPDALTKGLATFELTSNGAIVTLEYILVDAARASGIFNDKLVVSDGIANGVLEGSMFLATTKEPDKDKHKDKFIDPDGCDVGFGVAAILLLVGLLARKSRKV